MLLVRLLSIAASGACREEVEQRPEDEGRPPSVDLGPDECEEHAARCQPLEIGEELQPWLVHAAIRHDEAEQDASVQADGEERTETEPERNDRQRLALSDIVFHDDLLLWSRLRSRKIPAMVGEADPSSGWKVKPDLEGRIWSCVSGRW